MTAPSAKVRKAMLARHGNRCAVDGCTRTRWARGWCGTHYRRWETTGTVELQPRPPRQTACSVDGCTNERRAKGYCATHWRNDHLYGDPLGRKNPPRPTSCTAPGCDRTDMQGDYCRMHYHRLYRSGRLDARPIRAERGVCIIEGCQQVDQGPDGLCPKHATRVRRNGDPLVVRKPRPRRGVENNRWTGDAANYFAVHQRVRSLKGRARDMACVDCGGAAAHWSYNNSGVAERVSEIGRRYSLDPDQYEPRCVSCHSRFDALARESA